MNNNAENIPANIETVKRFLKRYRKNRELVFRLKDKLLLYEDRLGLKSPTLSDMPKGGTPTPKDEIIVEKIETEERVKRLEEKGKIIRAEILAKIDDLDNVRYAEILEAFCIDCKSFDEIADDIGYSERRVIAIYSEAIKCVVL